MKSLRALRILTSITSQPHQSFLLNPIFSHACYSAQPEQDDFTHNPPFSDNENGSDSVFDSSHFTIPNMDSSPKPKLHSPAESTWDNKFRARADEVIFGKEPQGGKLKIMEEEEERRRRVLAKALLEAALETADDDEEDEGRTVKEEDQKSLSVGIIGAPNAGKSALTNFMVGTKVAAVSRKTNTTTHEVLGIMTKGNTQICFFDTPGLMLKSKGLPYKDMKVRVQSAWSSVELYDVLIIIFDVHRHLTRPDSRVIGLIKRMGASADPKQKRILCMNKVDLVEKKKDLLTVAEQFKDLPGYEKQSKDLGMKIHLL